MIIRGKLMVIRVKQNPLYAPLKKTIPALLSAGIIR